MLKFNKGFTILELLITVAIIGILSGVIITNVSSAKKQAKDDRIKGDVNLIMRAVEMYIDKNLLTANLNKANFDDSAINLLKDDSGAPLIRNVPKDASGNYYIWSTDSSGTKYVIGGKLNNGNYWISKNGVSFEAGNILPSP